MKLSKIFKPILQGNLFFILLTALFLVSCNEEDNVMELEEPNVEVIACDAPAEIMTATDGTQFVRTPESCFSNLPDWPYEIRYLEIDGLRQAYIDEGPSDADPILLLHGQPSWSYLYRHMIPTLVDAGNRVIAMDHLGMGASDKPVNLEYHSFDNHVFRLKKFIDDLGLDDITLFVKDWGSVIGLWAASEDLDRYKRMIVGK